MSVSVAGRLIPQASALSELGRLTLAFIDGGLEWLGWASANPAARYEFADETSLMASAQQGLHASALALLPHLQLLVSPVKLMTLGLADLRVLAQAEGGADSSVLAAQLRRVLSQHQLVTQTDLMAGSDWLAQSASASSPLFQVMSLQDRLAISALAVLPIEQEGVTDPAALQAEAATFAAEQARTPLEFADYYRFYLNRAIKIGLLGDSAEQRQSSAQRAMQTLLPLLFGTLDGPQVQALAAPADVALAVSNWQARGKQIGFARLSEAVQQIDRHSTYREQSGEAARRLVDAYLQSAQSFIAGHRVRRGRMGQDGASCAFLLEAGNQQAELRLGGDGVISLHGFGARPGPPSAAASAPQPSDSDLETAS